MQRLAYIFIVSVLSFSKSSAQQELETTALNRITLRRNDTTYQFFVKKAPDKFKIQSSQKYYWFSPDTILITQGGFEGKLLDGSYKVFYPNKNLREEGHFENGTPAGIWKSWYPDGRLTAITTWNKGKKEGHFEEYNSDGKIRRSGAYQNDLLSGEIIEYQDNVAKKKTMYKDGQVVQEDSKAN